MVQTLASQVQSLWWLILIRGILFILLGIVALVQPVGAVVVLAMVFGIYAIVDGLMVTVAAIVSRKSYQGWGWLIAQGVLTVIAGILILSMPAVFGLLGILTVLWFLAISAFVGGIMAIVSAARSKGSVKGWGIVGGALDIIFGILIAVLAITSPAGTLLAMIWVVAIGAIVIGIVLVIASFRARKGDFALPEEVLDPVV